MIVQNLRPQYLNEFIGKEQLKNNLKIYINSAKKRNETLDHIIINGVAGTGKTTLANIIANEFDSKLKIIQGTQLKKVNDLINFISLVSDNGFLFIDEIHAMSLECTETLYSILEDFKLDVKIGVDNNLKITRISLPKFTLIGATTNISKIPDSLEDRFGINITLDNYLESEIEQIIIRSCNILNMKLKNDEISYIAYHCKGVPRIANNLVKRILDFKLIDENKPIQEIFNELEIYDDGLQVNDLKYLKTLFDAEGAIGIKTLSSILNIDINVIEEKIEPYLIRKNYVRKTNKGRELTKNGREFILTTYENHKTN